jgi:hypothetical protein
MEIAFYILLVSWVILLATCIVAISRFKKANDSLDTSLDTVIDLNEEIQSLMNQLDVAEQDLDFWKDTCDKMQGTINDLNKRIGNMKATEEDKPMVIEASYHIDHVRTFISVSKKIADRIETMDSNDLVELELSMENYIKRAVISDLLYYCNYAVSYEIFNDSYSFLIDIPVARKIGDKSAYEHAEILYPMVDIFKKLTERNKEV